MRPRSAAIAAGLALLAAAPAGAAAPKPGEPGWDPDRQICKSRPVVGSRLKRVRECASAQQWQEMEVAERMGLMRQQYNGAPGCNADPYVSPCAAQFDGGGRVSPR